MVDSSVNPLGKLKLDIWYKVLITIGAIILLFAVFTSNNVAMLLGSGLFLIGIGEWKNHKVVSEHVPESAFNVEQWIHVTVRKPDALGILFDILGSLALIGWGLEFFNIIEIV